MKGKKGILKKLIRRQMINFCLSIRDDPQELANVINNFENIEHYILKREQEFVDISLLFSTPCSERGRGRNIQIK
ncbi:MAG: hypothetical protein R6V04_14165 [bacterium]